MDVASPLSCFSVLRFVLPGTKLENSKVTQFFLLNIRVNFQCRGVLLIWMIVGQGPIALAVGAGGGCMDIFTLIYPFSSFSLSLGDGPI